MEKAILTVNDKGFNIICKGKDLKGVFTELYKIMLPTTKIGDIKHNIVQRMYH